MSSKNSGGGITGQELSIMKVDSIEKANRWKNCIQTEIDAAYTHQHHHHHHHRRKKQLGLE